MKRIGGEIGSRRHAAMQRAVSLVEQRETQFVRDQLLELYAIDNTLDVCDCVRERLGRLFGAHREMPGGQVRFDEIVAAGLASLPDDIRAQRVPDATWDVWLAKHRELARTLETALGLPSHVIVRENHVGHGIRTPVRG